MRLFFVILCLVIFQNRAIAAPLTPAQRLSDFNFLVSSIESGYGPLLYKKQEKIADLETLKAQYEAHVLGAKTDAEYYYLIVRFIAEFKDGHFGARLPTTFASYLPVMTDLIEGKVLVDSLEPTAAQEIQATFERGDEILAVDGQNIEEVLNHIQSHIGSGYELSARRTASWLVLFRPARMIAAPEGEVTVRIRKADGRILDFKGQWLTRGERLDEDPNFHTHSLTPPWRRNVNYDEFSLRGPLSGILPAQRLERSFMCAGGSRIRIPENATIILQEPFLAYYHPTDNGQVGYLRLPHYLPMGPVGQEFDLRFRQYEYAVRILEEKTVGLVIDQDHNCGGSVQYLEQILGLFMDKPYLPMQFQLRSNKEEFLSFRAWLEQVGPFTLGFEHMTGLVDLIRTSWIRGDHLTPVIGLTGNRPLSPNPIRYTKPIIVTIDEMSGSGGDAFPALIQGYGRARLLGTRTSGLGGHIGALPPLPFSQIDVFLTKSLFFRPDGVPVENNGAVPDIEYKPTRNDFMNGYADYHEFTVRELLRQIP